MIIETTCPDCRGRGHFSVIEGDIFKGYEACLRCDGTTQCEIEIDDDEVYEIIQDLFEQKHELILKYL